MQAAQAAQAAGVADCCCAPAVTSYMQLETRYPRHLSQYCACNACLSFHRGQGGKEKGSKKLNNARTVSSFLVSVLPLGLSFKMISIDPGKVFAVAVFGGYFEYLSTY